MKLETTPTITHEITLTIRDFYEDSKTYKLKKFVRDTKEYLNGTVHNLQGKKMKFYFFFFLWEPQHSVQTHREKPFTFNDPH